MRFLPVVVLVSLAMASCSSPSPSAGGPTPGAAQPNQPPAAAVQNTPPASSSGVPSSYDALIAKTQSDVAAALKAFVDAAQPTADVGDAARQSKTRAATGPLLAAATMARIGIELTPPPKDASQDAVALAKCLVPALAALSDGGNTMEHAAAFGDDAEWKTGFKQFDDGRRQFEACGKPK